MKIIAVDERRTKGKDLGDTSKGDPIPRIGEKIFLGYNPPPTVTDLIYIYDENTVYVCVDSPII